MLAFTRRLLPLTRSIRAYSTPPPSLLDGEQTIYQKLTEKFAPSQLQVQDVSGGCGSFYAIVIASDAFKGLSTLKQHKLVTQTLKSDIEGIHGLQIKTIVS
ncbi:bola-like protein [Cylindrobasidium torrendii FP15055 ss-10]|uniref:Bola-like protein n=1 Tax=Cylindrobasidium torrendii FP15055 ss-10 TaxID=1314674 RepID=A0A0D7BRU8_9AGAR|nr:bola-like protein [Cylindrobasidium torrendii FP15055 ss-10]